MKSSVMNGVFIPMVSQKAGRVLIVASTQKDRGNWFTTLVKRSLAGDTDVRAVVFDYRVCSMCRAGGAKECEHAQHLTPPWYDPEEAAQLMTIASREALDEMQGLVHGDERPAYDVEAVRAMVSTRVEVREVRGTVVVGVDPSMGGASRYGMIAGVRMRVPGEERTRLVILGWGCPKATASNSTSPSFGPRLFCDFLLQLFSRYGSRFNVFVCLENNMQWHATLFHDYVQADGDLARRVIWAREGGKKQTLGINKTHELTVRAATWWHTTMHEGAAVAERPMVYGGGLAAGADEAGFVESELERQFMDYEMVPTARGGVTYSGKRNGNDDLTAGAGTQLIVGVKIVRDGQRRDRYPSAVFEDED